MADASDAVDRLHTLDIDDDAGSMTVQAGYKRQRKRNEEAEFEVAGAPIRESVSRTEFLGSIFM